MKVMLFSGSHPRHHFIHQAILESGLDCAAVVMEREGLLPSPPANISIQDNENFVRHFRERDIIESKFFGKTDSKEVFSNIPTFFCQSDELNSIKTLNFVQSFNPDWVFIFGVDIIKDPVLKALPKNKVNLHLGLSPWYRGSATLFWPFYFLQPQFAGVTFHQIVLEADAGDIIHQSVPDIKLGDGIHDVSARAVLKAKDDLVKLISLYSEKGSWNHFAQKSSGSLFLSRHFKPEHLRVIYDLYDNDIVDYYLDNQLQSDHPFLFKQPGI